MGPCQACRRSARSHTGRFYSATIATIAETDPLAANRMFEQVRDQMDAASSIRIANMLRRGRCASAAPRALCRASPGRRTTAPEGVRNRAVQPREPGRATHRRNPDARRRRRPAR